MTRLTHLGREFHPRYSTHRWVIVIGLSAALWGGGLAAVRGAGLSQASWSAAASAAAAFLAWAIGRELDPDHKFSAILAAVATALVQPWLGAANLLGLAWCLGLARIVNGSTGLPPTASDLLLHFGAAALVGWLAGPVLPAVSGLGVVLAALIHNRPRWQVGGGLLHVITSVVLALLIGWRTSDPPAAVVALATAVGAVGIVWVFGSQARIVSTGDYSGEPLKRRAVQAAIALAALVVWLEWVRSPDLAIRAWFPLLAALLAGFLFGFTPAGTIRDDGNTRSEDAASDAQEAEND